ncbi:MAG TPA: indole-3-glycerol phosphate synthase TrpC [Terriglobia bacterium]|jgi:indole-3-glycerol phosphate synthase|nr:indole-3-glycerol phosphate synthase TrpC [Terriglobia bacterium]
MTILDDIVAACRARLEIRKAEVPLDRVREAAAQRMEWASERRDFAAALAMPGLGVIAEMKQASPSRGVLRTDYRPREIAPGYEAAGAVALSVLTEERFFKGSLGDLEEAREAVSLPVLRKDFILEPYQVYESEAAGADALLLIVTILSDSELRGLIELANGLELAALVEVHSDEEVGRAVAAGARIVGVNNRDLRTFEVNLETSLRLRASIPAGVLTVSESGIGTAADLTRLKAAGFDAALIGERLITEANPGQALAELLTRSPGTYADDESQNLRAHTR